MPHNVHRFIFTSMSTVVTFRKSIINSSTSKLSGEASVVYFTPERLSESFFIQIHFLLNKIEYTAAIS